MSMHSTNDWPPEPDQRSGQSLDSTVSSDPQPPVDEDSTVVANESDATPMRFSNRFEDYMEVAATPELFASYLDVHQDWFRRCAHPMQADPIDQNSYAITIGRFGAFDYYVEPKIGLELLPAEQGVYRIRTVSVPDYTPPGYAVDFQASMQLVSVADPADVEGLSCSTHVTWTLDLDVDVWFPRFIRVLPQGLIQSTGDRLLGQIVRQVSRRLTAKVQTDFHESRNVPFSKSPQQKNRSFF